MRILAFAKRNFKELIRDPINLIFCIGLPLFLLIIFQQFKIPSEVYSIKNFAPSIVVFSFGFISLFSGTLIAKDRSTSFLSRLFASPLTATDCIIGYTISLLPIAIIQSIIFLVVAVFLGLDFGINLIITILVLVPVSVLFIALGILMGSVLNDKQAPGLGSIVVQLVAFTSGMWFDIETMAAGFKIFCKILPFSHTINLARYAVNGNYAEMIMPLVIVILYTIVVYTITVVVFKKKMISDNK